MQIHLSEILTQKNISINSLSKKDMSGVARATLQNLANTNELPSSTKIETLERIATALNVDFSELVSSEPYKITQTKQFPISETIPLENAGYLLETFKNKYSNFNAVFSYTFTFIANTDGETYMYALLRLQRFLKKNNIKDIAKISELNAICDIVLQNNSIPPIDFYDLANDKISKLDFVNILSIDNLSDLRIYEDISKALKQYHLELWIDINHELISNYYRILSKEATVEVSLSQVYAKSLTTLAFKTRTNELTQETFLDNDVPFARSYTDTQKVTVSMSDWLNSTYNHIYVYRVNWEFGSDYFIDDRIHYGFIRKGNNYISTHSQDDRLSISPFTMMFLMGQ